MYHKELAVLAQLEQSESVKRETGIAHTDLADVLSDMGQFDAARQEYEASQVIIKSIMTVVAVNLGQLGTLALRQNDLNEARRRYLEALASFAPTASRRAKRRMWHQLGMVAEEAHDWPRPKGAIRRV